MLVRIKLNKKPIQAQRKIVSLYFTFLVWFSTRRKNIISCNRITLAMIVAVWNWDFVGYEQRKIVLYSFTFVVCFSEILYSFTFVVCFLEILYILQEERTLWAARRVPYSHCYFIVILYTSLGWWTSWKNWIAEV